MQLPGAVLNFITVLVGGSIGLLLARFLPERVKAAVPNVFGLFAIGLGASLFVKLTTFATVARSLGLGTLVPFFSAVLG